MSSKPKKADYKPSEADKASASVAKAEFDFFKKNYDPLLREIRDRSLSDDKTNIARARTNADTMQLLTEDGPSLQQSQRVDASSDMAQAVQGQLAQANVAGLQEQNKMQSDVLSVARGQGSVAQQGMGVAARIGTSEALGRAKAKQIESAAKFDMAAGLAGSFTGQGLRNIADGKPFFGSGSVKERLQSQLGTTSQTG